MRIFLVTVISVIFVGGCKAVTWSENATHPDYPGKCVYQGIAYEPGEHHVQQTCTRVICSGNGWISGHTCLRGQIEGCVRGSYVDKTRPFPNCCLRVYTCQHGDGTEYTLNDY